MWRIWQWLIGVLLYKYNPSYLLYWTYRLEHQCKVATACDIFVSLPMYSWYVTWLWPWPGCLTTDQDNIVRPGAAVFNLNKPLTTPKVATACDIFVSLRMCNGSGRLLQEPLPELLKGQGLNCQEQVTTNRRKMVLEVYYRSPWQSKPLLLQNWWQKINN